MSSLYYKLCYGINHLKADVIEHYYFSRTKKTQHIRGSKHGEDKRHVIPPMSKHGGIYFPHPLRIYALGR